MKTNDTTTDKDYTPEASTAASEEMRVERTQIDESSSGSEKATGYSMRKPKTIIIRARIIHDKD
jgi:hypothetical protein